VDLGYEMVQFDYDLSPHFRYLDISLPSARFFVKENRPKLEEALLEQISREQRTDCPLLSKIPRLNHILHPRIGSLKLIFANNIWTIAKLMKGSKCTRKT